MAQRCGGDELRGGDTGADGAQPRPEGGPDEARMLDGEGLQEALSDQAYLDMAVVGIEFASHGVSIPVAGTMQVLGA